MKRNILLFSLLLLSAQIAVGQQAINTRASKVTFDVSNMSVTSVDGTFSGMQGTIRFNPSDLSNATLDVCIQASSVDTENSQRDEHLQNEDFFEVDKYPTICFQSSAITRTSSGYLARGTLTMHGVTKTVSIPFTFANKTFTGELTIDRYDYDVGPSSSWTVGREIEMEIVCVLQ